MAANTSAPNVTESAVRAAISAGASARQILEAIRMVHLFGGFPRTLNALEAAHRAFKASGMPLPKRPRDTTSLPAGRRLFAKIYSRQAHAVSAYLDGLDPVVAVWIQQHAYGRVLSRRGLDAATREVLAVAALTATGQERQLVSHALGALRCGSPPAEVLAAFDAGARGLRAPERKRLRAIVATALPREERSV